MKPVLLIVALTSLIGCSSEVTWGPDQCLRADLFQQCLKSLPAGPGSTKYNDWDEVVKECEAAAYRQSLRNLIVIKPECKV